jgi:hypothetical protein
MDQNLGRYLVPPTKFGRALPATAATAPAALSLVYLQVVGREQMAIAAKVGNGHGLADTSHGKAHHMSFGCLKARPRYQFPTSPVLCSPALRLFCWFSVTTRAGGPTQAVKLSSFEALAAALDTAGVRYLIAGGLAVAAHGYLSLPTLIRMKEEANRPQDRADIEQLRGRSDNDANK